MPHPLPRGSPALILFAYLLLLAIAAALYHWATTREGFT